MYKPNLKKKKPKKENYKCSNSYCAKKKEIRRDIHVQGISSSKYLHVVYLKCIVHGYEVFVKRAKHF